MNKTILKTQFIIIVMLAMLACEGPDNGISYQVILTDKWPELLNSNINDISGKVEFEELNTGVGHYFKLPLTSGIQLPLGVYNISAEMHGYIDGQEINLRSSIHQYTLACDEEISLNWWIYNPKSTLVFGELFFTGSLNAKGTGGMYDTYFTIYNNTEEVQYADGLAIVESKLHNATTDLILTPQNQRDINFTAQAIYVIPGDGKDVPIAPGKSIKIVDQAIDWSEHVPGALNHTDADFEWYDESTSATVVDTDNPQVPNLDKWFCYTLTIWLPSNQCNRSYALVRFPKDMTMDSFLAGQKGDYDYINSATGIQMKGEKCYLIRPEWIIDGVNLCPTEKFTEPVLPQSIDRGYAAISHKNSDTERFGKKFVRVISAITDDGRVILQDTDNSAADFEIVSNLQKITW